MWLEGAVCDGHPVPGRQLCCGLLIANPPHSAPLNQTATQHMFRFGNTVGTEPGSVTQRRVTLDIVIVDDSEDNVELLAELLRVNGHTVRTALDGVQALRLFEERVPEVALLDLGLPGMSGYELAAAVRERFGDEVMLCALTGFSGAEVERRIQAAGFDRLMSKPLAADTLYDVLEQAHAAV